MSASNQVARWNSRKYASLLRDCYDAASSADRGRALEDFLEYCFTRFRGLSLQARDLRGPSQELDLVFFNDRIEQYFASASAEIIVEAKNWATPVGSPEVSWFLDKMRKSGVTHGFFIAGSGITGACRDRADGAIDSLYMTLQDRMRPVVLTLEELAVADSRSFLTELFKAKCCLLFAKKL